MCILWNSYLCHPRWAICLIVKRVVQKIQTSCSLDKGETLRGQLRHIFILDWTFFWIKKRKKEGKTNLHPYAWFYNVIHVWWCVAWYRQNGEANIHTNHTAEIFFLMWTISSSAPHFSSCLVEWSLCVDLADVISTAPSLPPSELWLTCSLIYSQRGADDGPGCVRGGQGSRWCDRHNKEQRRRTGDRAIVTAHRLQPSGTGSWYSGVSDSKLAAAIRERRV